MRSSDAGRDAGATLRARRALSTPHNFSAYDCCHWGAAEFSAVEWGVARFAGGIGGVEFPFVICGEDCYVGWFVGGYFALDA